MENENEIVENQPHADIYTTTRAGGIFVDDFGNKLEFNKAQKNRQPQATKINNTEPVTYVKDLFDKGYYKFPHGFYKESGDFFTHNHYNWNEYFAPYISISGSDRSAIFTFYDNVPFYTHDGRLISELRSSKTTEPCRCDVGYDKDSRLSYITLYNESSKNVELNYNYSHANDYIFVNRGFGDSFEICDYKPNKELKQGPIYRPTIIMPNKQISDHDSYFSYIPLGKIDDIFYFINQNGLIGFKAFEVQRIQDGKKIKIGECVNRIEIDKNIYNDDHIISAFKALQADKQLSQQLQENEHIDISVNLQAQLEKAKQDKLKRASERLAKRQASIQRRLPQVNLNHPDLVTPQSDDEDNVRRDLIRSNLNPRTNFRQRLNQQYDMQLFNLTRNNSQIVKKKSTDPIRF